MCKSKSEGGDRCNTRVARMLCGARGAVAQKTAAGEPVTLPAAPRDRGIVNPEQTRIFSDRWPKDEVDVVIRRNVITNEGLVVVFNPAKGDVFAARIAVGDQDRTEQARRGVVMAVNKRTGEYVTYEARDTNGVWTLGIQVDQGAETTPASAVPDWLANNV